MRRGSLIEYLPSTLKMLRINSLFIALLGIVQVTLGAAVLTPDNDPFYQPPAGFASSAPGTVFKNRTAPSGIAGINAVQILYRTSYINNTATATVATILTNSSATRDKLVAYDDYEDSANTACAPSYLFNNNNGNAEFGPLGAAGSEDVRGTAGRRPHAVTTYGSPIPSGANPSRISLRVDYGLKELYSPLEPQAPARELEALEMLRKSQKGPVAQSGGSLGYANPQWHIEDALEREEAIALLLENVAWLTRQVDKYVVVCYPKPYADHAAWADYIQSWRRSRRLGHSLSDFPPPPTMEEPETHKTAG
ncbi:hypothetical protein FIBSPDRAFT_932107 [Athelia psychrophila]|uniref:triacylglycerol lipase n=1 Tax=Athelia psychrophila TaxID=1759441 RepID=A0A166J9N2_9AGAM|nr:hypothetical protein FIBSPDRAFT_932107 [Fibularhizoctonia sp. CBS 109695]